MAILASSMSQELGCPPLKPQALRDQQQMGDFIGRKVFLRLAAILLFFLGGKLMGCNLRRNKNPVRPGGIDFIFHPTLDFHGFSHNHNLFPDSSTTFCVGQQEESCDVSI